MITRTSTRKLTLRVALGAVLALGAPSGARAAEPNDAWITTKAKIALLTTRDLGATGIDVDTLDGRITLHGTVTTDAEKTRAASVAKGITGVRSVDNLLQVVPAKNPTPSRRRTTRSRTAWRRLSRATRSSPAATSTSPRSTRAWSCCAARPTR